MHLTIGNGVHVNTLTWTISNGTNTYSQPVFITDDAGHEAQSVEFVAGGIQAGSGYVVTLSGVDSDNNPCTGLDAGHGHGGRYEQRDRHRHLHRPDRRGRRDDGRQRQHRGRRGRRPRETRLRSSARASRAFPSAPPRSFRRRRPPSARASPGRAVARRPSSGRPRAPARASPPRRRRTRRSPAARRLPARSAPSR